MDSRLDTPDSPFPLEITAYDFGADLKNSPKHKFGLKTANAIATIRKLADRLEANEYILQSVETSQHAKCADFAMSKITIEYAEVRQLAPAVVESLNEGLGEQSVETKEEL